MSKSHTLLTAACLLASVSFAQAQQAAPKPTDEHHPPAAAVPAAPGMALGAPGAAMPMMGGDMGKMMQSMMPMMRQMMAHDGMMRADGPMGMMAPARVEGRIAFLKTELKITDAQAPLWTAYANVLRAEAKSMSDMRGMMMPGAPAPAAQTAADRADQRVKRLTAQLESAKTAAIALRALYAVLDDSQKKSADELLGQPMGRM